jgi:hypothetical protein
MTFRERPVRWAAAKSDQTWAAFAALSCRAERADGGAEGAVPGSSCGREDGDEDVDVDVDDRRLTEPSP